jgi:hypothetical protein
MSVGLTQSRLFRQIDKPHSRLYPLPVLLSRILEPPSLLSASFLTHTKQRTRTPSTLLLSCPTHAVGFLVWAHTLIATLSER